MLQQPEFFFAHTQQNIHPEYIFWGYQGLGVHGERLNAQFSSAGPLSLQDDTAVITCTLHYTDPATAIQ
jgi:hypothetical protein